MIDICSIINVEVTSVWTVRVIRTCSSSSNYYLPSLGTNAKYLNTWARQSFNIFYKVVTLLSNKFINKKQFKLIYLAWTLNCSLKGIKCFSFLTTIPISSVSIFDTHVAKLLKHWKFCRTDINCFSCINIDLSHILIVGRSPVMYLIISLPFYFTMSTHGNVMPWLSIINYERKNVAKKGYLSNQNKIVKFQGRF